MEHLKELIERQAHHQRQLVGGHAVAYIAGPMSGVPDFNFPLFDKVARKLRKLGWTVISPAELDSQLGFIDGTDISDNSVSVRAFEGYMRRDLPLVALANCLVLLPGWEKSKGANLELVCAIAMGHDIYLWDHDRPHYTPYAVPPRHDKLTQILQDRNEAIRPLEPAHA
jgi:hypothetical protein